MSDTSIGPCLALVPEKMMPPLVKIHTGAKEYAVINENVDPEIKESKGILDYIVRLVKSEVGLVC